jgi:hypothetical protein
MHCRLPPWDTTEPPPTSPQWAGLIWVSLTQSAVRKGQPLILFGGDGSVAMDRVFPRWRFSTVLGHHRQLRHDLLP